MMKQIFYPGIDRQPCQAQYAIIRLDDGKGFQTAHIVVAQDIHSRPGTFIGNLDDEEINNILNGILDTELRGIRTEFIEFDLISYTKGAEGYDDIHGMKRPFYVDIDDYIVKGNPYIIEEAEAEDIPGMIRKANSRDVVAGCARFMTNFEHREHLSEERAKFLLEQCGVIKRETING